MRRDIALFERVEYYHQTSPFITGRVYTFVLIIFHNLNVSVIITIVMSQVQEDPSPAAGQNQLTIQLVESVSKSPVRGAYTSLMRCNGETHAAMLDWPFYGPKLPV